MKKIMLVLFLILLIPSVSALGIERVEFFEVEQGSTQTIVIDVYTSPTELENDFTYEIISNDKNIRDWITVSPEKFTMAPGEQRQPIKVTLTVPITAELGDYNAELKYAGSRVSGGGTIGYTVATKSVLHFKVVKEGAKKKIDFITMDAKPYTLPHEIAKFSSTIKNTGNIPVNYHVSLIIEQDYEEIFKIDSPQMDLGVGLFEDVVLYWEPEQEGNYTGHFKIIFDDSVDNVKGTMLKSDSFLVVVSNQIPASQTDNEGFSPDFISDLPVDPTMMLGILFLLAAAVFIIFTFKPTKKVETTNINNFNNIDENKGTDNKEDTKE